MVIDNFNLVRFPFRQTSQFLILLRFTLPHAFFGVAPGHVFPYPEAVENILPLPGLLP